MRERKIIISCEHGGNHVPVNYQYVFSQAEASLNSHLGWDPGSIEIAKYLARHLEVPAFYQKVSRLLVEMNRSIDNPQLFSAYSMRLTEDTRQELLDKYYYPYRNSVESKVVQLIDRGFEVLHLSIHTFTPELNGIVRAVDIGLLYDPERLREYEFCRLWKSRLDEQMTDKLVLYNCPYNGADDGLTTYLRNKYSPDAYLGIELEISQRFVNTLEMNKMKQVLYQTLMYTNLTA